MILCFVLFFSLFGVVFVLFDGGVFFFSSLRMTEYAILLQNMSLRHKDHFKLQGTGKKEQKNAVSSFFLKARDEILM